MRVKMILVLVLSSLLGHAQNRADYDSTFADNRCIELKATDLPAYDKSMIYEWNMGDGNISTGLIINHCYENDGAYVATLAVIDPEADARFEEEYAIDILINQDVALNIIVENLDEGDFNLSGKIISKATLSEVKFYWDIGGDYQIAEKLESVSLEKGTEVRLLAKFQINDLDKTLSKTITIQ